MSERYVLDASAVLCLIRSETGADIVKAALPNSIISAVNLAEVVAKMADLGMDDDLIARVLEPLDLRIAPFDAAQARASGALRRKTRDLGLSLGDRACLACAAHLQLKAMTTDRAWAAVAAPSAVTLVR